MSGRHPLRASRSEAGPHGFFPAQGFAAFAPQGLAAFLPFAPQGLVAFLALGAHGLAPWAADGTGGAATKPPIAAIVPSIPSDFLSAAILLCRGTSTRAHIRVVTVTSNSRVG